MLHTTAGRLLLRQALPADMHAWADRPLDKKGVAALFQEVAERHPGDYAAVAQRLSDVARAVAYATGGFSFGLEHMRTPPAALAIRAQIRREIDHARARRDLDDAGKDREVVAVLQRHKQPLEDAVFAASRAEDNPLAHQVANVGRGNRGTLQSLRAGDLLYVDHRDRPIPVPVTTSYAEGLRPPEYFAASFGARRGVYEVKAGTAQSGFLCLDEETLVRMADGTTRAIKDIVAGDHVVAWDIAAMRPAETVVVANHANGVRDCVRYRFYDCGQKDRNDYRNDWDLVATPEHQALCVFPRSNWGTTQELRPLADYEAGMAGTLQAAESAVCPAGRAALLRGAYPAALPDDPIATCGSHLLVQYRGDSAVQPFERVGPRPTRDLEVAHHDHLFVLASGLIVANSKQLNQATHRLVVTGTDYDDDRDRSTLGLPVATDDPDNEGALLARTAGPYPRDTVLSPRILRHLQDLGVARLLVRSPIVGGPPQGGVLARDVGVRERGALAPRGDFVGIAAAQALGERMSQSSLGSKHTGGVAGAAAPSGFRHVNALVQIPKVFPYGATHAQRDGTVGTVAPAPQGGHNVTVDGVTHYVPADRAPTVAPGDKVEAGDVLSTGLPNPAEIVRHQGIGAGRRHFVDAFRAAYRAGGLGAHRRNIELLARGLIDHVRLTDEVGEHVPDDIVPYAQLEASWRPRPGARALPPKQALGKYLERPVLHYSVGTVIRPSTLRDLADFGIKDILVHDQPPPFVPVMVRGLAALQHDPDWMTRHLGSNLEAATLEAAHRGRTSDPTGTSYVPAVAERLHFGRQGLTRGWDPRELGRPPGPRDADKDGWIEEGTPRERPASVLADL